VSDYFDGPKYAGGERLPTDSIIYTVYLDSGSYQWLLEVLRGKQHSLVWLKPYQRLVARTLLSFQEAAGEQGAAPPTDQPPLAARKRVIKRRK
jgi:hypothetical protein